MNILTDILNQDLDPVETLLTLAQRAKSSDEVITELSSWYLPT